MVREVSGPFNIASEPVVGTAELCSLFDARPIDLSAGLVRRLADLSWRLHLQPTGPGWVDMAGGPARLGELRTGIGQRQ